MNRYSIKEADFPAAIKYIKNGKDKLSAPNWAIKFKDDLIGSEFVIDNPNAQSGCGCGTSFAV